MTKLNLSADEVLLTTRSVRKRLDFDRPVERSVVEECLEIALQAPTGSNSQGWHWVIVEDPAKKKAIADVYAANFAIYANMPQRTDLASDDPRAEQQSRVVDSATYLTENFHRAPLMLIPCIEGRLDKVPLFVGASLWGSLLPAVWSFMLALRERSLGSAWTTIHLMGEGEKTVADLLGIPDTVSQGGLFPIAYTIGTDFKPAKRLGLDKVMHWDSW
jgi:nitroreductase